MAKFKIPEPGTPEAAMAEQGIPTSQAPTPGAASTPAQPGMPGMEAAQQTGPMIPPQEGGPYGP